IAKGKQLQHVEKSFCEKEEPLEERLNEHIESLKNISVSSPADKKLSAISFQPSGEISSALIQQFNELNKPDELNKLDSSTNPISPISSSPFSPFGQMDAELPFFPIGPPDSIIGSVRDNRFHRNEQIRLGLRERLKAQGILPDKRSVELIKRVSLMLAMLERGIIVTFASNSPPDFSYILEVSFINIEGKSEEAKNDKANKKQRIRDGNKESGDPVYNRGIIIEKKGNYPTGSRTGKPARDIYPYGSFKRAERTSGKLDLGNKRKNHPAIIEIDQDLRRLESYYYEISYFIWAAVQNSLIQFGSDSSPPSSLAFSPSTMLRTDGERSQTISFQHSAFSEYKPSLISSLPIYKTIEPLSWATVAALEVANSIFEGPDVASQLNDSGALEKYKNYEVAEGLYVASPLQGAFPATLNTLYAIRYTLSANKKGGTRWISYQLLTINHQLNWNSVISWLTEKGLSLLQHGMKATKFITSLSISLPGESLSKLTAISSQLKEKGQRLFAKMLNIGTEFSPPTASPTLISANYASRYPLSAIHYLKERAPAYAKKQFAKTDLAPAGRRGGALEGTRYKMQDVGLREVDFSVAGSPILNPYLNDLTEEEGKLRKGYAEVVNEYKRISIGKIKISPSNLMLAAAVPAFFAAFFSIPEIIAEWAPPAQVAWAITVALVGTGVAKIIKVKYGLGQINKLTLSANAAIEEGKYSLALEDYKELSSQANALYKGMNLGGKDFGVLKNEIRPYLEHLEKIEKALKKLVELEAKEEAGGVNPEQSRKVRQPVSSGALPKVDKEKSSSPAIVDINNSLKKLKLYYYKVGEAVELIKNRFIHFYSNLSPPKGKDYLARRDTWFSRAVTRFSKILNSAELILISRARFISLISVSITKILSSIDANLVSIASTRFSSASTRFINNLWPISKAVTFSNVRAWLAAIPSTLVFKAFNPSPNALNWFLISSNITVTSLAVKLVLGVFLVFMAGYMLIQGVKFVKKIIFRGLGNRRLPANGSGALEIVDDDKVAGSPSSRLPATTGASPATLTKYKSKMTSSNRGPVAGSPIEFYRQERINGGLLDDDVGDIVRSKTMKELLLKWLLPLTNLLKTFQSLSFSSGKIVIPAINKVKINAQAVILIAKLAWIKNSEARVAANKIGTMLLTKLLAISSLLLFVKYPFIAILSIVFMGLAVKRI
ncbi:MAG: hypothetical protein KKE55_00370, partial [Candidatus Omnitrophica bacterium]|nr:hypothetical protein [Candidatus Omnitrophota bacterium]